jgi:serine/threonine-protein kinase RsbW/stage II sporulation protein AB (anti-sigma F factor)
MAAALPAPWARTWPAVAASVGEIRTAVAEFAAAAGAGDTAIAAVKLAVSEAATNAVLHAYVEHAGPGDVHVTAEHRPGAMCVVVRDDGRGMLPRSDSPGSGFGLVLIGQFAEHHEVVPVAAGGTSLRMRFSLAG